MVVTLAGAFFAHPVATAIVGARRGTAVGTTIVTLACARECIIVARPVSGAGCIWDAGWACLLVASQTCEARVAYALSAFSAASVERTCSWATFDAAIVAGPKTLAGADAVLAVTMAAATVGARSLFASSAFESGAADALLRIHANTISVAVVGAVLK